MVLQILRIDKKTNKNVSIKKIDFQSVTKFNDTHFHP